MLIKAKPQLIDITNKGDKTIFRHMQDNRPVMQSVAEQKKEFNPSFMLNRPAWPVAEVPSLTFFAHPEFTDCCGNVNWKAFNKWLQTDEGRQYKIAK